MRSAARASVVAVEAAWERVDVLEATVAEMGRRLAALERTQPRTESDTPLSLAIAVETEGAWVTAAALLRRAVVSPALHEALTRAWIDDAGQLGTTLRRLSRTDVDGFLVERGRRIGDGFLWRVRVAV